jgi:PAS domain S-box-containing protein
MTLTDQQSGRIRTLVLACIVAALCYLVASLGGMLILKVPQTLWPLWPGCALLVAILLVSPPEIWSILLPAGLAGFLLYDLQAGVTITSIAWLILADSLEILVAAWGLRHFSKGPPYLNSLKSLAVYSFFTVIIASLIVASLGILGLNGDRWISWRISLLSEALAFLTVTPAMLGWVEAFRQRSRLARAYYIEAATLASALIVLSYVVFIARESNVPPPLLYSLVPFLLWSALRFGSAGAGTSATIVALLSTWATLHGRGPFNQINPIDRISSLQLFLLFTAVPFMVLAVLVEERRRQQAVLLESEERFRLMADTAPTMIWMAATDKLCTFFNRGWLNFTGKSMQKEVGDGWLAGVHPEDTQRCMSVYSTAFDARADFEMEYRLCRYDGEYRWIVDCGVPRFGADGMFCGYIGSCVDITELKQSEMSLRELTGRLIHAQEEERGRIARELHDDISQRMALLQIGLEQFENSVPGPPSNHRQQLHNLAQVASEVSSDLHSLSHRLHPARLDLQGLVAAIGGFCRELASQYELQIQFLHHDVPEQIPTDVTLCVFRIIQEALRNVVKHSKTPAANVELSGTGDEIDLCISDSGVGFNPEVVRKTGGLGLVSMRERLRLIGGRMVVESEPLRGTRIRVRVPLSGFVTQRAETAKQFSTNV